MIKCKARLIEELERGETVCLMIEFKGREAKHRTALPCITGTGERVHVGMFRTYAVDLEPIAFDLEGQPYQWRLKA
jgi:hypothetical protein